MYEMLKKKYKKIMMMIIYDVKNSWLSDQKMHGLIINLKKEVLRGDWIQNLYPISSEKLPF